MANHYDIKEIREVAELKGGKCLSKEYIDLYTPLEWMCEKGHTWDAPFLIIRQGGWCRQCTRNADKEERLKEYRQIAIVRGGECLSSEYIRIDSKLKWRCAKGHEWTANPGNVRTGSWCPVCASTILNIEEMQAIAKKHGGECLTESYKNSYTKLKWRCANGHVWLTTPKNIKKGMWCIICAIGKKRLTLADMHSAAAKKNGKCLSSNYINSRTPVRWQCHKKHTWMATPSSIIQGTWCGVCAHANRPLKYSIDDMQSFAKQKGGKCLSKSFKNVLSKLKWQCRYKHIFITTPESIIRGSWCPACAGVLKYTLDDMRRLAKKKEGKCLSSNIINLKTKLAWQCRYKHTWMTTGESIVSGNWCPYCSKKAKHTIEEMQSLALKHGGKCISLTYKNVFSKLIWQCRYKHIFVTTPQSILKGHWCGVCARHKTAGEVDYSTLAQ